ncbi:hypothetical protein BDQ94DRAFT_15652 [Aspergillus welwitschiae]|uniref:Uncharacterized protein n=1 Tax=Aspergillus welwitschiae TaxID=1341132 RepID=A0A3F3Q700_9EURO|nr:hypothetical protein BDQ94DRAFT_15652 [Aspergillus welwitschiae]RDH34817.1 hypothetical protein BDQ94DRAFT_15652 [Aspergillus welwitschiae]
MLRRPCCWESKSTTKSFILETLGPRFCSVYSSDRRPEAMSSLVLSTNIRCGFAWLDASACDTQCLVVCMLGWFLIRPHGFPLTLSGSKQQISSWYWGVLYEQAKDRRRQRPGIAAGLLEPITSY